MDKNRKDSADMNNKIPSILNPLLENYLEMLTSQITNNIVLGVYLYGSISLGEFNAEKSDIDFVVVLRRKLNEEEIKNLKDIHFQLNSIPFGKRMDSMYITVDNIGKNNNELDPYPYCSDGKIKIGHWDINEVTWWLVKHHGIEVFGPNTEDLNIHINWSNVVQNMKYNINQYWFKKAKNKYLYLFDDMVEFSVSTISRILCSLENKEIFSKNKALEKSLETLPLRWHLLLEEGLRIRNNPKTPSLYTSRFKRAKECKEYILFAHNLCNKEYFK